MSKPIPGGESSPPQCHPDQDFDTTKYLALEHYSPRQWADLIEYRLRLNRYWHWQQSIPKDDPRLDVFRTMLEDRTCKLLDLPLTCPEHGDTESSAAVWPLQWQHLYILHQAAVERLGLVPEVVGTTLSYSIEEGVEQDFDQDLNSLLTDSPIYGLSHVAHFQIDLSRSNDELFKAFKECVDGCREKTDFRPLKITQERLSRWAANRILPYFDLQLWARVHGENLRAEYVIEKILPDSKKLLDHPLESTRSSLKDAMSMKTVQALRRADTRT